MKRKRILPVLLLAMAILLMTSLPAVAISAKKILKKVEGEYNSLKDFTADFTQTVYVDSTDSGYASAGRLRVKKPDMFHLDLEHHTIISDGDTLWTYVPHNQQVLVDQPDTTVGAARPDQLFLTYFKETAAELIRSEEVAGRDCYLLHLEPEGNRDISCLRVWVDKESWLARRLEVTDMGGMITDYQFTAVQVNPGLADSAFVFRPPPEVEIIDLRW
jgi:outer membrane lipoprotein carrier protein